VFFTFSVCRCRFFCPLSDFFWQKNGRKEKETGKILLLTVFKFRFPMLIWRKSVKTVTRKTDTETVIHCYISFIHLPTFRSMKNTKRKMLFLFRLWRFRIHCQSSAFHFHEQGKRWKTKNGKGKRFPCLFVSFPWKTENAYRFSLTVSFLVPFCVSHVGIKRKKKKNENGKRLPLSYFLLSVYNIRRYSVFLFCVSENINRITNRKRFPISVFIFRFHCLAYGKTQQNANVFR